MPRAMAPEKHEGLSAMRELALLSAESALIRHARHQKPLAVRSKLAMAALLALPGLILILLWQRGGYQNGWALYASFTCGAGSVLWALQIVVASVCKARCQPLKLAAKTGNDDAPANQN